MGGVGGCRVKQDGFKWPLPYPLYVVSSWVVLSGFTSLQKEIT